MKSILGFAPILMSLDATLSGGGASEAAAGAFTPPASAGVTINNGDLSSMLEQIDLTNVNTDRPILKPGLYEMAITKMEMKDNKKKDGKNLIIELKLLKDAEAEDGKKLNAGFPLFDIVSLVKMDNYNPLERLAQIQLAALGKKQNGFRVADLIGRNVFIRVKKESSEEFGDQNRIGRYVAKTDPTASQGTGALSGGSLSSL